MSPKEIEKTLKRIDKKITIAEETIDYLTKNKSKIITKVLKKILEKDKTALYKIQENKEFYEEFERSINTHFQWIINHSNNNHIHFNNNNDLSDSFDAYCLFYKTALKYIDKNIKKEALKKNIKAYISHIKNEIYC